MAVYKPTDCNPFNGSFDIQAGSQDLPIMFECKIDTNNSKVSAYSIKIFDSENNQIFPSVNAGFSNTITFVNDLYKYYNNNFSSSIPSMNTGINGTYLRIPFVVSQKDTTAQSTVSNNQVSVSDGVLQNGNTYIWSITLYQQISKNNDGSINLPSKREYYDMSVANGTVLGSTKKRIHTAIIEDDEKVVKNLVLIDKYIQPVYIDGLVISDYEDLKQWSQVGETSEISQSGSRVLINSFDSLYGHIYPSEAAANSFSNEQITPDVSNGFRVFKNGNNSENLGAQDMVSYIINDEINETTVFGDLATKWKWNESLVNPSEGFWTEEYSVDTSEQNPEKYPLGAGIIINEGTRVILNHFTKNGVVSANNEYVGSPYNGIYYAKNIKTSVGNNMVVSDKIEQGIDSVVAIFSQYIPFDDSEFSVFVSIDGGAFQSLSPLYWSKDVTKPNTITVYTENSVLLDKNITAVAFTASTAKATNVVIYWYRAPGSATWGELSNAVIFNQSSNSNFEINSSTPYGTINKTPLMFVEEQPIKLFNTAESNKKTFTNVFPDEENNRYTINIGERVSDIISLKIGNEVVQTIDYGCDKINGILYYTPKVVSGQISEITLSYTPWIENDYTGLILYNDLESNQQRIFVRSSPIISTNMIFEKIADKNWTGISKYNKKYSYIITSQKLQNIIVDETRYQIKTFYRESDLNPFSLYASPAVKISYEYDDGTQVPPTTTFYQDIERRNFTARASYTAGEGSYVLWKSYSWILYSDKKRSVLYEKPETYDGEIFADFYGLEGGQKYVLVLIITTNSGKIITIEQNINANFAEEGNEINIPLAEGFNCDLLAVESQISVLKSVIVPRADKYIQNSGEGVLDSGTTCSAVPDAGGNFYWKDGVAVAKIENSQLVISNQNRLEYSVAANDPSLDSADTNTSDIKIPNNIEDVVVESEHVFSENYSGEIFSVSGENDRKLSVIMPSYYTGNDTDGYILNDNRNEILYRDASGKEGSLKISGVQKWQENQNNYPAWLPQNFVLPENPNIADYIYVKDETPEDGGTYRVIRSDLGGNKNTKPMKTPIISHNDFEEANYNEFQVKGSDGSYEPFNLMNTEGPFMVYGDTASIWEDYKFKKITVNGQSLWVMTEEFWYWPSKNEESKYFWYDGIPEESYETLGESSLVSQTKRAESLPERAARTNGKFSFRVSATPNMEIISSSQQYYYTKNSENKEGVI